MNERMKELRKYLKMNQTEFGNRIGVKQGTITGYENGTRQPLNTVISSICREFGVNEAWLRDGSGEMFIQRTRSQVITDFTADLILDDDDSFRRRLVEALAELDLKDWEVLEVLAKKLAKKKS